MNNLLRSIRKK